MKGVYRGFCLFLMGVVMVSLSLSARSQRVFRETGLNPDVIIDAGHGGVDGGAASKSGVEEKDVNLLMALELQRQLEEEGLEVLMVRTEDISIHDSSAQTIRQKKTSDLKNRLALANAYPDAIFVSIHQNSFPSDPSVKGTVLYYGSKNPKSLSLAEMIRAEILTLQPDNRKVIKKADRNLYLLSNAQQASVLVECGFLSNPSECELLTDPAYRRQICEAVRDALIKYLSSGFISQMTTG